MKLKAKELSISGLMLAVGIILPFATSHAWGIPGNVLLPMHIPVLLTGLLCGPVCGGIVGALLPVLNCVLTGMPPAYPMLPIMFFELLTYGVVSGLLYRCTPLKRIRFGIYPALIGAMLSGRVLYGIVFYILLALNSGLKALSVWGAVTTGAAGIVLQLVFVPPIVMAVESGLHKPSGRSVRSAKLLIKDEDAALVVIKDNKIVKSYRGRGVSPSIAALEDGELGGAYVVDKVVGKAAAMILSLGGIKGCFAVTASRPAAEFLKESGVALKYDNLVDFIENRSRDGVCPMEQTVMDISDPNEALIAVKKKLEDMKNSL